MKRADSFLIFAAELFSSCKLSWLFSIDGSLINLVLIGLEFYLLTLRLLPAIFTTCSTSSLTMSENCLPFILIDGIVFFDLIDPPLSKLGYLLLSNAMISSALDAIYLEVFRPILFTMPELFFQSLVSYELRDLSINGVLSFIETCCEMTVSVMRFFCAPKLFSVTVPCGVVTKDIIMLPDTFKY